MLDELFEPGRMLPPINNELEAFKLPETLRDEPIEEEALEMKPFWNTARPPYEVAPTMLSAWAKSVEETYTLRNEFVYEPRSIALFEPGSTFPPK